MELYKKFFEILKESVFACSSNNIALSGGLDSSAIAYFLKKPKPYTVIAKDFVAHDLTFSQIIAKDLGISPHIITIDTEKIISAVEQTIKILQNFNDIEIRNSVVIFLVASEVKKSKHTSIITGDGADELFAGYDFLLKKSDDELQKDLARIAKIMHFPSKKICDTLGITIETPFLNPNMIEFAKKLPVHQKVGIHNNKRYGKMILRKAFEGKISEQIVWRTKTPMQNGAGTSGLTDLFEAAISDHTFYEKVNKIKDRDGITIRTKESLHYYTVYRKYFDVLYDKTGNACPDCTYTVNTKFCRMCGRFPV